MSERTDLPLWLGESWKDDDGEAFPILRRDGSCFIIADTEVDALRIITAVNNHDALVDALKAGAMQFDFYAMQHALKGTAEGDEKSATNRKFANRYRALLAKIGGEG